MINNKNILELELRNKIYQFIHDHPGIYQREISRKLKIPKSTLAYHLKFLEKRELIVIKPGFKYKHHYVKNNIGNDDKQILALLEQEISRKILFEFLCKKCITRNEISKSLERHPNTITFHLNRMLKLGIIEPAQKGKGFVHRFKQPNIMYFDTSKNETVYILKIAIRLENILITHRKNIFTDKLSKEVSHLILDEGETSNETALYSYDMMIDGIVDVYDELFPNPICA